METDFEINAIKIDLNKFNIPPLDLDKNLFIKSARCFNL